MCEQFTSFINNVGSLIFPKLTPFAVSILEAEFTIVSKSQCFSSWFNLDGIGGSIKYEQLCLSIFLESILN